MRRILSERNIVVVLFVMVLITFSLAQEDSKKMERLNSGAPSITATAWLIYQQEAKAKGIILAQPVQSKISSETTLPE